MADSVSFQIDIDANAASAVSAAAQISALTDKLTEAGAASRAASDALDAGNASYAAAEQAANRAAMNVERLGQKAIDLAAKMQAAMDAGDASKFWRLAGAANELEQKMARAAEQAAAADAALAAEASSLAQLQSSANAAATALSTLEAQQSAANAAARAAKDAMTQAAAAAQLEADQIDSAARRAIKASQEKARAEEDAVRKAIAESKRQHQVRERLAKAEEGAVKAARGTGKVNELAEAFGRLGGPAGQAGQQVFGLADGLRKLTGAAGKAGPYIAIAVAITAITFAAVAATAAILKWGIELADAKRDAGDVLKLSNQFKRFKKLLGETFGGLKTDGLMRGLETLINLFDKSTASGKALAFLFESIFQPIIDLLAKFAPTVESFFLGMVIGALKLYIALKPVGKAISEFLGGLDGFINLKTVGEYFFYVVVAGAALATLIGGVLVVAITSMAALLYLPIVAIGAMVAAFWWLVATIGSALGAAWDAVSGWVSSAISLGSNFVSGLIQGIMGGASALISAVVGLAGSAVDAVKGALGISSPSRVMMEMGAHTAEGFTGGIEDNAGGARSALESMVAPPAPSRGSAGGGGGITITIGTMTLSGANAQEQAEDFFSQVRALLAGDAIAVGAG